MIQLGNDCVIDTNVFCHSNNSQNKYCESANIFLEAFKSSNLCLCVDDEYNSVEAQNTSWIASEYFEHNRWGSKGYTFLQEIFSCENRIKQVSKSELKQIKRFVTRHVADKTDVIFICVAVGTTDKVLVSNDYTDMPERKRTDFHDKYSIRIISSTEAIL